MSRAEAAVRSEAPGRYVYCLALAGEAQETKASGLSGIEGRTVEVIGCREIVALVHRGPASPYSGGDEEAAASWVLAHHRVVEEAWRRWPSILPMTFNTIVVGTDGSTPEACLQGWVEVQRESLLLKLRTLRGRVEYGIQVSWNEAQVARAAAERSPELEQIEARIATSPRGLAYMLDRKREMLFRHQAEKVIGELGEWVAGRVATASERVRMEPPREGEPGFRMVVNLSCLSTRAEEPELAGLVRELGGREGYRARLVGPLPPYSFA